MLRVYERDLRDGPGRDVGEAFDVQRRRRVVAGMVEWAAKIVLTRIRDRDVDYEIYAMNANGGCETQLTDDGAWDLAPTFGGRGNDRVVGPDGVDGGPGCETVHARDGERERRRSTGRSSTWPRSSSWPLSTA